MMPEIAAGTTTRVATCRRSAPSPYAPSRSAWGTADIASSESDATVGISITPDHETAGERVEDLDLDSDGSRRSGVTAVSAK